MCMSILPAYMSVYHIVKRGPKRAPDTLILKLEMVVSRPVGAGKSTSILWKGT